MGVRRTDEHISVGEAGQTLLDPLDVLAQQPEVIDADDRDPTTTDDEDDSPRLER